MAGSHLGLGALISFAASELSFLSVSRRGRLLLVLHDLSIGLGRVVGTIGVLCPWGVGHALGHAHLADLDSWSYHLQNRCGPPFEVQLIMGLRTESCFLRHSGEPLLCRQT